MRLLKKAARTLASFVMVGSAAWFGYRHFVPDSDLAIIGAPLREVYAPISGIFAPGSSGRFGVREAGNSVGKLSARLPGSEREERLSAELERLRHDLASLTALGDKLAGTKSAVRQEAAMHRAARAAEIGARIAEGRAQQAAASKRAEEAEARLNRSRALAEQGLASREALEAADRDYVVQSTASTAALQNVEALNVLSAALSRGVDVTTTGAPFFAAEQQQLRLRDQDLEFRREELTAELQRAERELAAEQRRNALRDHAELTLDFRHRPWKQYIAAGMYVHEGARLLSVLECSRPYVLAGFSPRHATRLIDGARATIELSNPKATVSARVTQVLGPRLPELVGELGIYVPPENQSKVLATVLALIEPDTAAHPAFQGCNVGLPVEVRLE